MAGFDGLHPVFRERLEQMCRDLGLTVTSGYRSSEKQRQLYECWKARKPGCAPANPPGKSNHEAVPNGPAAGLAADLGPRSKMSAAHAAAAKYKLRFPIANEPWHCQPQEVLSTHFTGDPFGGHHHGDSGYPGHPLRRNAKGPAVCRIQSRLRQLGHAIAEVPGCPFGPQTEAAVKAFQASRGLKDDGIVGPKTWTALAP
ncbi:MAG TPA: peptidoglycan-binding protein [Acidimicrobiales bacterium]|nr:peptidoglycan-binding protein [Acidimicrobiales bacterium]